MSSTGDATDPHLLYTMDDGGWGGDGDHHVPVMWFTYGQRNTTMPEQRSVTTGCGERALSKSNQPLHGEGC